MTKKKMVEFTTVTDYQQTFRICLTDIWEEICKEQYFEDGDTSSGDTYKVTFNGTEYGDNSEYKVSGDNPKEEND